MHIKNILSLAAAMLVAGPAFAHEGEHTQTTFAAVIEHYATHLDHLLPIVIALIVIGVAVAKPSALARVWRSVTRRKLK